MSRNVSHADRVSMSIFAPRGRATSRRFTNLNRRYFWICIIILIIIVKGRIIFIIIIIYFGQMIHFEDRLTRAKFVTVLTKDGRRLLLG